MDASLQPPLHKAHKIKLHSVYEYDAPTGVEVTPEGELRQDTGSSLVELHMSRSIVHTKQLAKLREHHQHIKARDSSLLDTQVSGQKEEDEHGSADGSLAAIEHATSG